MCVRTTQQTIRRNIPNQGPYIFAHINAQTGTKLPTVVRLYIYTNKRNVTNNYLNLTYPFLSDILLFVNVSVSSFFFTPFHASFGRHWWMVLSQCRSGTFSFLYAFFLSFFYVVDLHSIFQRGFWLLGRPTMKIPPNEIYNKGI